MTFENYAAEFTKKALDGGYSGENILKCLVYAKPLIDHGLPVIYNTSHFSGLVGYRKSYITKAVHNTKYYYRHFQIKKNNGKQRVISEPLPSLKDIQCWILSNILEKIPVGKPAKAYVKNTTLKQNLVFHRGQDLVLKMDIADFFGSIKRNAIETIFRDLGYSKYVSNLLGKICCLNTSLPQGAPTSPYLSNLYMRDFDKMVWGYCTMFKIRYTRYSDDLTFSGSFDPSTRIKTFVTGKLLELGLVVNDKKTKVMTKSQRQTVTGIVVNEKIQVDRKRRKAIRLQVYYIKKFTLQGHLKNIKNNRVNYLPHLLGQINYVLFINPDDAEFLAYRAFVSSLLIDEAGSIL